MVALIFGLIALFAGDAAWRGRGRWSRARWWAAAGASVGALVVALAALPGGYMLQKVVASLAMPAGLLWCALFAAAFVAWHRRALAAAAVGFALWVGLGIAGNQMLGSALLAFLERDYADASPLEEEPFDAVFVLGGGTGVSPSGEPQAGTAGDRVVLAARLYHRGVAPVLVTSGSSLPGAARARDLSAEALAIWKDLGIDEGAVIRVPEPVNTSEEIAAFAELRRERGWDRVGLVTSAWHMPRAMGLALSHDLYPSPLPADFRGDPRYQGLLSLIPTGSGFRSVQRAAWEFLGAAVGR